MTEDDCAMWDTLNILAKMFDSDGMLFKKIYVEPKMFFYICRLRRIKNPAFLNKVYYNNCIWHLGSHRDDPNELENIRKRLK